ncbi:patatin family protein [Vibrio sp. CAIM 722]|uniref:Patatin family protein n=1 Tax=Vibrio eleionomae TaxID=2653505 RepID=A0A7X4LHR6_9VIBR|nr:DUF6363 domain-containing protein [Vibrio eleionomae]MZI92190.1 patatin family protein [Vibrio eleionomae]
MGRNSGTVSDTTVNIDEQRLSKFIGGKSALVAQGGGQRGIFTAGVFDAFLLSNFDPYNEYFGTSAGALNLCPFLCRQHGLSKSFICELTTDPSFFHLFSYIRRKQYLNLDWALDQILDYPYKLDVDMGRQVLGSQRKAFAAVTSTTSLNDHYFPMLHDDWREVLTATCAIPGLYPGFASVGGELYMDGGVSAAIPVQEAWRRSARFITVVRTECVNDSLEQQLKRDVHHQEVTWFKDSLNNIQLQWQNKLQSWKNDWGSFLQEKQTRAQQANALDIMNGGRWFFGAGDIYRMGHLLGQKFDSGFADMLMVHYQTYSLTREFLQSPPDDVFIVQIAPQEPLKSGSLMSKKEDLFHDYRLGLQAGFRFIESYQRAVHIWSTRTIYEQLGIDEEPAPDTDSA